MKYWIGVACRDHVLKGVDGGFAQLCHGKEGPLKRMKAGDWLIYYSSKEQMNDRKPYQKFTAIGRVKDDDVYRFDMGNGFIPSKRNVEFIPCNEVSIRPFITKLSFIKDEKRWGYPFRFGHLEILKEDFELISEHMKV